MTATINKVLIFFFLFSIFQNKDKTLINDSQIYYLEELNIQNIKTGNYGLKKNTSLTGDSLCINSVFFTRGISVSSISKCLLELDKEALFISGKVGLDYSSNVYGSVKFYILGDKKVLWESGLMKKKDNAKSFKIELKGIKYLGLLVTDGGDSKAFDYADWIDVKILSKKEPQIINLDTLYNSLHIEYKNILSINSPDKIGFKPAVNFSYYIPISGKKPISVKIKNLPQGCSYNPKNNILFGKIETPGRYKVTIYAKNYEKEIQKELVLQIGDKIQLTPPMGWNSWNCFAKKINSTLVKQIADKFIESRLIDYGWSFIIIDDSWQGKRGGEFNGIQGNTKFANMDSLSQYINSKGLKLGIYSTPWITSFAGFCGTSSNYKNGYWDKTISSRKYCKQGKYTFEINDINQFSKWKIEYLKYDWNPIDKQAITRIKKAIDKRKSNIVFSISNSANINDIDIYKKNCNLWRTTSDIKDEWFLNHPDGKNGQGILDIFNYHNKWQKFQEKSNFNDPDMLVLDKIGWGKIRKNNLTLQEQFIHYNLWIIWSSPLILGNDIRDMSTFTMNLLKNEEALKINQDTLAQQGKIIYNKVGIYILKKKLSNNSYALAIFNFGNNTKSISNFISWPNQKPIKLNLKLKDLGFTSKFRIYDIWEQRILNHETKISVLLPYKNAKLLKLTPINH